MKTIEAKKAHYIAMIRHYFEKNMKAPGQRDIGELRYPIIHFFGTWNNALKSANLAPIRNHSHTKAKLKKSLIDYYVRHKRAPRTSECTKANGLADPKIYIRVFGVDDWTGVLKVVGLERFLRKSAYNKDLDAAIKEILSFIKKEKILSAKDYERLRKSKHLPTMGFIHRNFGGWHKIMILAGLKADLNLEKIIKAIRNYYEKNGSAPTMNELSKKLKASRDCVSKITGSYNKLLADLGLPLNGYILDKNILTKEELKQLYIEFSQKNGYTNGATIKSIKESREMPSHNLFIDIFGAINDLRKACGYSPLNGFNAYSREEIIHMLSTQYLLFRRPLTSGEIENDQNLPSVRTIFRYLKVFTLKEVWVIVKKEVRYAK